jgi:hypothetical protein
MTMARARGANARMRFKFETTYGTPPGGNYVQLPFVSSNLGPEQPLIESDLLGQGREAYDPTLDVVTNDGDVVVPVDARAFGYWLKMLFGDPVTAAEAAATGTITFSAQPAVDSTITINGTAFTFKASGASGNQINIAGNTNATVAAIVTALNGSAVSGVAEATYSSSTNVLTITDDTAGIGGNAFTLAASAGSNGTVSGATLSGGTNSHTFTSGSDSLPSAAIEIGLPDVPSYEMNYGVRANTMRIEMTRRGLLNATIGCIAKGADAPSGTSGAGTPTSVDPVRFAQATGSVTKDGSQLGSVVSASLMYSNNLDKVETIEPDGEIEDADPGQSKANGNVTVRFANLVLHDAATGEDPIALTEGWTRDDFSLTFSEDRVFLPRTKTPVTGPAGVQASFDWQGSGQGGHVITAVLVNDVATY